MDAIPERRESGDPHLRVVGQSEEDPACHPGGGPELHVQWRAERRPRLARTQQLEKACRRAGQDRTSRGLRRNAGAAVRRAIGSSSPRGPVIRERAPATPPRPGSSPPPRSESDLAHGPATRCAGCRRGVQFLAKRSWRTHRRPHHPGSNSRVQAPHPLPLWTRGASVAGRSLRGGREVSAEIVQRVARLPICRRTSSSGPESSGSSM
jgi:hypothetical protein